MAITPDNIRENGLLELYVLGDLTTVEKSQVIQAVNNSTDLKIELIQIERAFKSYADAHGVEPSPQILERVLQDIRGRKSNNSNSSNTSSSDTSKAPGKSSSLKSPLNLGLAFITMALAACSIWSLNNLTEERNILKEQVSICNEAEQQRAMQLAMYRELSSNDNQIVMSSATEKYPQTKLVIHNNSSTKRNFLQIQNLPEITDKQSYQLWSLKGDTPPTPLNVFQGTEGDLIEVDHIDNTDVYAITIEDFGGKESPDLANIISVFKLVG